MWTNCSSYVARSVIGLTVSYTLCLCIIRVESFWRCLTSHRILPIWSIAGVDKEYIVKTSCQSELHKIVQTPFFRGNSMIVGWKCKTRHSWRIEPLRHRAPLPLRHPGPLELLRHRGKLDPPDPNPLQSLRAFYSFASSIRQKQNIFCNYLADGDSPYSNRSCRSGAQLRQFPCKQVDQSLVHYNIFASADVLE